MDWLIQSWTMNWNNPFVIALLLLGAIIFVYNVFKVAIAYRNRRRAGRALELVEKKIAGLEASIKQNRQRMNDIIKKQYDEMKNQKKG